jgi:cell division protein ZapA
LEEKETAVAQVAVKINGYTYNVGCEDGQEQHLLAMAEQVERRIDSIKALGGNSGEARLLMLASLLMADEIHDLRIELEKLNAALARAKREAQARAAGEGATDAELTRTLNRLAGRAEQIAAELERP